MVAWGDVPAWVAAVATVGTFTGGLIILVWQGRQLRLLRDEATQGREGRERSQASLVSAWPVKFDIAKETVEVAIGNMSNEPVWNVQGIVFSNWKGKPERVFFTRDVIEPLAKWVQEFPLNVTVKPEGTRPHILPPVVIVFTDSAGTRWARNAEGRLRRLSQANKLLELVDIAEQPEPWLLDLIDGC